MNIATLLRRAVAAGGVTEVAAIADRLRAWAPGPGGLPTGRRGA